MQSSIALLHGKVSSVFNRIRLYNRLGESNGQFKAGYRKTAERHKMTGRDKTVIVIDDQDFVRGLVAKMMLNQGFARILEASDGRMALDMLLDASPDLIICDILMRPMDGLSFLQVLRENHPDFENIPVIFMTNDASSEIVLKAMSLGASGILVKPVSPSKLEEQVRVALDPAAPQPVYG